MKASDRSAEWDRPRADPATGRAPSSASGPDGIEPPLSVCFLINKLAPDGAPTVVLNIVENTASDDVEYTVCFFGGDDTLRADFESHDARVVDFGAVTDYPQFDPRSIPRMVRFFAHEEFDILHCHLPYSQSLGRVVGRLSGVEHVVSTQHNVPSNYHPVERIAERLTRPLDSRTVCVSEGVQVAFTGESNRFTEGDDHQWCTIRNGIDVDRFNDVVGAADPAVVYGQWDLDASDLLFVNVARYEPQKGQLDLVEAMETVVTEIPRARLLVVGWGSLESRLRDAVAKKGLDDHVVVTGRVPSIAEYYAAADVFVTASLFEGLPVTVLEAMAAELPVVATDIPGVREVVVDGETGRLCPAEAPDRLARAMVEMAAEDRREEYARGGIRRVSEEFDIRDTVAAYLSLYRNLGRGPR